MRPEDALQKSCVEWLTPHRDRGLLRFYHIPNAAKRGGRTMNYLKSMGFAKGVCDLVILIPKREHLTIRAPADKPVSLYMEMKAGDNKLEPEQSDWAAWLLEAGFQWFEVRTLDELRRIVEPYIRRHLK